LAQKKHKLSVSFEDDYGILGLLSDEPDYKLCWLMNEHLNTGFSKVEDIAVFNKKAGADQLHSMFYYSDENAMLTYRLIRNRAQNGYFLTELKNMDYFLHIQGEVAALDTRNFIERINSLEAIRMCIPVDLTKIQQKDRFYL